MIKEGDIIYLNQEGSISRIDEVNMSTEFDVSSRMDEEKGPYFVVVRNKASEADHIRAVRDEKCFPIINRGTLWYSKLNDIQMRELSAWYEAWLDAPETMVIPEKPSWLV